jgi:hypothetical protein
MNLTPCPYPNTRASINLFSKYFIEITKYKLWLRDDVIAMYKKNLKELGSVCPLLWQYAFFMTTLFVMATLTFSLAP